MDDLEQIDERDLVHGSEWKYPFNNTPPSTPPEVQPIELHGSANIFMRIPGTDGTIAIGGNCHVKGVECSLKFFFLQYKVQFPFDLAFYREHLSIQVAGDQMRSKGRIELEYSRRMSAYFGSFLTDGNPYIKIIFTFFEPHTPLRHFHRTLRNLRPANMTHYDEENLDEMKEVMKYFRDFEGFFTVYVRIDGGSAGIPFKEQLRVTGNILEAQLLNKTFRLTLPIIPGTFLETYKFFFRDKGLKRVVYIKFCLDMRLFTGLILARDQSILMTFYFLPSQYNFIDSFLGQYM